MYIKKEDFLSMDGLYRTLDSKGKKEFIQQIMKAYGIKPDEKEGVVRIVEDDIFDRQAIAPEEFVTRTMIKKIYREIKRDR